MRARLVYAGDEEADTVGPAPVGLCVDLSFVSDGVDDAGDGDGAAVD